MSRCNALPLSLSLLRSVAHGCHIISQLSSPPVVLCLLISRRRSQLAMAFSNYSNLFKCGLLSEGSSPSYASDPWATEYCGPRRGSLPFMDTLSEISDVSAHPPPPSSSSGHDTSDSFNSDGSFYFTFKKKRNVGEHRSFLSLDLAEAQSLRSVNLKGKGKEPAPNEKLQQPKSATFSPSFDHSYVLPHYLAPCAVFIWF